MISATAPLVVDDPKATHSIPSRDMDSIREILMARARQIAPIIRAEALNTEEGGTLSPAAVAALRDTELFWATVPREVGGFGCDLVTAIEIMEEVSYADGSSGWSLMANKLATSIAAAFAGDDAIDAIFGKVERPILAGLFGPGGKSVEVDGG